MDNNAKLIAGSILAAGLAIGGGLASQHQAAPVVAPMVDSGVPTVNDGCQTQRVHTSNWSPRHKVDDAPTYEVRTCGGKVVSQVEVERE